MSNPADRIKNLSLESTGLFRQQDPKQDELSPPSGAAMTPQGDMIVSDDFNHRLQIYDKDLQLKTAFGQSGKNPGEFMYPKGIAVDAEGNIYAADSWNHRVQKFDSQGNHLFSFGSYGEDKGQLNEPYDVFVEPSGKVIIVERYNHRVQFFTPEGESLGWIGSRGTVLETQLAEIYETPNSIFPRPSFEFPTSIASDSQGNYYISDSGNHRILKFDCEWNLLQSIGEKGKEPGQFQYPLSVSTGKNDLLYVADLNNDRIQVFTSEGLFLYSFKDDGDALPLKMPHLTFVNEAGELFIGLTFTTALFQFKTSATSKENLYNELATANPNDAHTFYYQGKFYEEAGSSKKASECYATALKTILSSTAETDTKVFSANIHDLPVRLLKSANQVKLEPETENLLLECLGLYDDYVTRHRDQVLEYRKEWLEFAPALLQGEAEQQKLILEQKDDPLTFDKELYQLTKKEKTLFRNSRLVFYNYRKASEVRAEFLSELLLNDISPAFLENILDGLSNTYRQACGLVKNFLEEKEKNEESLVASLHGMQNDRNKWKDFHEKSVSNVKAQEIIKHLLFEVLSITSGIKNLGLKFLHEQTVCEKIKTLLVDAPDALLFPRILLGLQEAWKTNHDLDSDYKDLLDTFLSAQGFVKASEAGNVADEYFAPVPYDTEAIEPQDILNSYLAKGLHIETTDKGLVVGGKLFELSSIDNTEKLTKQIEDIFAYQETYEQKADEVYGQLKEIFLHRPDVISQLTKIDARDKKTPTLLNNNLKIIAFQDHLLIRMLLTLEINELKNMTRLITGCSLLHLHSCQTSDKDADTLFDKVHSRLKSYREKIGCLSLHWRTYGIKKAGLESQAQEDSRKIDLSKIIRSDDIRKELEETNFEYLYAQASITRYSRLANLLDKFFDFKNKESAEAPSQEVQRSDKFSFSFGRGGMAKWGLLNPFGVTHTLNGEIIVADHLKQEVLRFSSQGLFINKFGRAGNSPGSFMGPYGACSDKEGSLYIADLGNRRIQKFSGEGKFLQEFGQHGEAENNLGPVFSCSVDAEGNLWAADLTHHRIQIFSRDGKFIRTMGQPGEKPENLFEPVSIVCLEDGHYVVGDRSEHLLKLFDAEGKLTHTMKKGSLNPNEMCFSAYDPEYGIFVADSWNFRVIQLNRKLEPVRTYGKPGIGAGEFCRTSGVSVFEDTLVVGDFDNQRLQVFNLEKP